MERSLCCKRFIEACAFRGIHTFDINKVTIASSSLRTLVFMLRSNRRKTASACIVYVKYEKYTIGVTGVATPRRDATRFLTREVGPPRIPRSPVASFRPLRLFAEVAGSGSQLRNIGYLSRVGPS